MNTNQIAASSQAAPFRKFLWGTLFLCLIMQLFMVLRFEVNQDEFYNLNLSYEFLRGEVGNPFQTLLFRFFGWLKLVPGNEIDQIVVGRLFTYAAGIITCLFVYKTSRRYFSPEASLFALTALLSFAFVFRHITAFRRDILITMLLMGVIWVVSDPNQTLKKAIAGGLMIGLAFSLALKSIFYMPIVAIFLIGRWMTSNWSRQAFLHGLTMFVVAILTYIVIFVLHDPATYSSDEGANYLKRVSGTSFKAGGLFRQFGVMIQSVVYNPFGWALIFFGFTELRSELKNTNGRQKLEKIALLSFIIPATTPIYYYHAHPYYYIFMLAPAAVFIAAAADRLLINKRPLIYYVLIFLFCILPVLTFVRSMSQHQNTQRATINAVHQIFPNPVPIIDFCGMVSSFDRVNEAGLFLNPDIFAHSKYMNAGQPIMRGHLKNYQPQILLANATGLDLEEEYEHEHPYEIHEEDTQILKDNYLKFWGPIYVPGKTFDQSGSFEILVAGTYTYFGTAGAQIDDNDLQDGQAINLAQGNHEITGLESGFARLVWGDNLQKPDIPETSRRLFHGF